MRVSLRWLRDYAVLDAPVETLARALVETGTEVGAVEAAGEGLLVARVVALEPLPGSAHGLQFADLDIGERVPAGLAALRLPPGPVRVVSGASNLRAGQLVPYAPPGSRPPAMDAPLGVRTIRDHVSPGMLCSAVELGTGDDAAGILELEKGRPGQPLSEVLDLDTTLDLEVTTNRPDCLCHVGIARELSAALGEPLTEPSAEIPEPLLSAASAERRVTMRIDDAAGCPRFVVRVVEGVVVGPSPGWLQRRLRAVGLRPINNVVDVTNFVAHELGQPLHAFDFDTFAAMGGDPAIAAVTVRRARHGEHLVDLGGVDRELAEPDLLVCAGDRPASLAGLIGGLSSAVGDATRTVLLEAASWDGPAIRATSRRLGLRTDASTLFEKGLSDLLPPIAVDRAAALIAGLAGGHVLRGVTDQRPRPLPELGPIALTARFIGDRLGLPVDASEVATVLARLGFAVEQDGAALVVYPPYFRRDVALPEDVVEEVGRMTGYARVPSTLPGRRVKLATLAPPAGVEDEVREICVGAGFDEAITLSFVAPGEAERLPGLGLGRVPIPLRNPLSEEWSVLRIGQLPRLCAALASNVRRGIHDVALFELGRVFWDGERQGLAPGSTPGGEDLELPSLPLEPLLLSVALHDPDGDAATAARALRRVQALFDRVVSDLGEITLTAGAGEQPGLHPGRAAALFTPGSQVGIIGELLPEMAATFELRGRVLVGELRLDALLPATSGRVRFDAPPDKPAIVQDLAVIVPAVGRAGAALEAVREAGSGLLESVDLYDEYRGDQVPAGWKGWTFRLTFRAHDRTLTGEEAQRAQDEIAAALQRRCAAQVRR